MATPRYTAEFKRPTVNGIPAGAKRISQIRRRAFADPAPLLDAFSRKAAGWALSR